MFTWMLSALAVSYTKLVLKTTVMILIVKKFCQYEEDEKFLLGMVFF